MGWYGRKPHSLRKGRIRPVRRGSPDPAAALTEADHHHRQIPRHTSPHCRLGVCAVPEEGSVMPRQEPKTLQEYIDECPIWGDGTPVSGAQLTSIQWRIWWLASAGKFF